MNRTRELAVAALAMLALASVSPAARAATCGNSAVGYEGWKQQFAGEARAKGIGAATIAALMATNYAQATINADRGQRSFQLTLDQFLAKRGATTIVAKGRQLKVSQGALFASIQQRYGVPPGPLLAIWGMETGFGTQRGNQNMLASIATLAYDCRRSDFFTNELNHALKIVQRGDMSPASMRGGWAGEIGPMQFMASSYYKFAIDFDGDGRRNLMSSTADMLASTANYLAKAGWSSDRPWGWEVTLPKGFNLALIGRALILGVKEQD